MCTHHARGLGDIQLDGDGRLRLRLALVIKFDINEFGNVAELPRPYAPRHLPRRVILMVIGHFPQLHDQLSTGAVNCDRLDVRH